MSQISKAKATEVADRASLASSSSPRSVRGMGGDDNQTKLRVAIAQEMVSEILECPLDDFLEHYAPFVPSQESITNAFQAYKDDERTELLLEEVDDGDKKVLTWTDFVQRPAKADAPEVDVFKPLEEIVNFLKGVGCRAKDDENNPPSSRACHYSYRDCPSATMKSEIIGTDFRVDACITSNPDSKEVVLSDTAVLAEFKKAKKTAKVADNRRKLVSAASHTLNDDPRRTWIYGITIEDTRMSVWYFCRSHSVKSKSFDFTKDIEKFIHVFLSLLYATPEEIGYDSTVHRAWHNNGICYIYEMGTEEAPRYFRTKKLLFTPRVLCITGRKTRVWEAIEVEGYQGGELGREMGQPVALKDGWLDEGSWTEGEIQAAIFACLGRVQEKDYKWASERLQDHLNTVFRDRTYKDYFMEISDSRKVAKTKSRSKAAKPKPSILSSAPSVPADPNNVIGGSAQGKDRSGLPTSLRPTVSEKTKNTVLPREYRTKEQHRLIYHVVGYPLHDAEDLKTSFNAIRDACIALVLMYLAGWTHRDVSTGNIIVLGSGDMTRGKLSDLEYAKQFDDATRSTDPKTGTPFFMPLEIHASDRLYDPPASAEDELEEVDVFANDQEQASPVGDSVELYESPPPPKFRFQHDLESLWWIALWILLYRVKHPRALEVASEVFTYSDIPSDKRSKLFAKQTFAPYVRSIVHPNLSSVVKCLDVIRKTLYVSYTSEVYSADEVMLEASTYSGIYEKVWKGLSNLIKRARNVSGLIKLDVPTVKAGDKNKELPQKRPRPEPKPRDDDEYRPGTDDEDESDADNGDNLDTDRSEIADQGEDEQPQAKRLRLGTTRRRQIPS